VLTTTRKELEEDPKLVESMVAATRPGYRFAEREPQPALGDLLAANPSLERADQAAQLRVLLPALHPAPFSAPVWRNGRPGRAPTARCRAPSP